MGLVIVVPMTGVARTTALSRTTRIDRTGYDVEPVVAVVLALLGS